MIQISAWWKTHDEYWRLRVIVFVLATPVMLHMLWYGTQRDIPQLSRFETTCYSVLHVVAALLLLRCWAYAWQRLFVPLLYLIARMRHMGFISTTTCMLLVGVWGSVFGALLLVIVSIGYTGLPLVR